MRGHLTVDDGWLDDDINFDWKRATVTRSDWLDQYVAGGPFLFFFFKERCFLISSMPWSKTRSENHQPDGIRISYHETHANDGQASLRS